MNLKYLSFRQCSGKEIFYATVLAEMLEGSVLSIMQTSLTSDTTEPPMTSLLPTTMAPSPYNKCSFYDIMPTTFNVMPLISKSPAI